jgi:hypothetical protein
MPFTFGSFTGSNSFGRLSSGASFLPLTFINNGAALTFTNNGTDDVTIAKTAGSNSWNAGAYATTPFTAPVTAEFYKQTGTGDNGASYAMIGWNVDPTTNASYTDIDYAVYPYQSGSVNHYHNGSNQGATTIAHNTTKKFYLVYATDGYQYLYWGSTMVRSFNRGAGQTVYLDTSFYSVNATFSRFFNIRVIRRTWNGTNYV